MKKSYPKLLHWKAKQFDVEDDQAKVAWGHTRLMAMCMMLDKDHAYVNQQFESRLQAIGALNKIYGSLATMSQLEKYALVTS